MVEHIIDARFPDGTPSEVSCVFKKDGTPSSKAVRTLVVSFNMLTSAVRAPAPAPAPTPATDDTVVAERLTLSKQVSELGAMIASQRTAIQGYRTQIDAVQGELEESRENARTDAANHDGIVMSLNEQNDVLKLENARLLASISELEEHIESLTGNDSDDDTDETDQPQTT